MLLPNFNLYLHLIARAIAKSYIDPAYKAELLNNPKSRLQRDCQTSTPPLDNFPDDLLIQIDESSDAPWRIVPLSSESMSKAILFFPLPIRPEGVSDQDIRAFANSPLTAPIDSQSSTFELACWFI